MSESTAVARREPKPLAPEVQARIQEAKERNAIVKAIRGTQWGSNLSDLQRGAVAEYCRQAQIDAVRHVEILGGRLYLTAEFYDERGAALIQSGEVEPLPPEFIHVDERLEKLAADGNEWAKTEKERRLKLRIQHAAPEEAKATCIWTFRIKSSGALVTGVNWCGGETRRKMGSGGVIMTKNVDPIGDLDPTKTAETRARRRAWRKISEVLPSYAAIVKHVEDGARSMAPVVVVEAPTQGQLPAGPPIDTGQDENYAAHGGVAEEPARPTREPGEEEELELNDRRPRD